MQQTNVFTLDIDDLRTVMFELLDEYKKREKTQEKAENSRALLTTTEVVELLHCTRKTLWEWANNGYLVPIKVGRKKNYYHKDQVMRILKH